MFAACLLLSYNLDQWRFIVNWISGNKLQWNSNQNTQTLLQKDAFENVVCKMATILFKRQGVISIHPDQDALERCNNERHGISNHWHRLFGQQFVQAHIKWNVKALCHRPEKVMSTCTGNLWGESLTKVQRCGVLMFSLMLAWTSCWTNSWVHANMRHDAHCNADY